MDYISKIEIEDVLTNIDHELIVNKTKHSDHALWLLEKAAAVIRKQARQLEKIHAASCPVYLTTDDK